MSGTHATTGGEQGNEEIQVVQFLLGEDRYCITIDRVAELVDMDELTPIPNAPEHVEGVMDLRGVTTTIVDPRVPLGVDEEGPRERVIVLATEDGRQSTVGWVVDEVEEVRTISLDDVDTSTAGHGEEVQGIARNDGFVVWLDPDAVNA